QHPRTRRAGGLAAGDVGEQHAGGRLALDHRVLRRRRELQGKHLAQVHPDREPLVAPLARRTGVVAIGGGRGAEAAGGEPAATGTAAYAALGTSRTSGTRTR